MNCKLYFLIIDYKTGGLGFVFKRMFSYLVRPLNKLLNRNKKIVEIRYEIFPNIKQHLSPFRSATQVLKLPKSELIEKVRYFWYSNIPGEFDLDGEKISRREIFVYGGPNPRFTCPICQKSEWLSRIRQKNLFITHSCFEAEKCKTLCSKQGDELWTNLHQNFDFSIGCDPELLAPKCLSVTFQKIKNILKPTCNYGILVSYRQGVYACQIDVVDRPINIDWRRYDFLMVVNQGFVPKFPRPPIPVILYCHDFWPKEDGYQWVIDWLKPDVIWTPYPTQWKEYFKLPPQTKIVFRPFFESTFFTRPNLNNKKLDLLVIGATASSVYGPRISLTKQISQLPSRYKIEFSQSLGYVANWPGPVEFLDPISKKPLRYLNKWSEYLSSAKYVIFGKMRYPILVGKYYETLGSGAIPIFPEVPDLKLLGVKPFKHYIPLSEVEGNNHRLIYFLNRYEDFKYIAENAVKWYKSVSDKMLFSDYEDLIKEITGFKYSKRLI